MLERAHQRTIAFLDSLDEPDLTKGYTNPGGYISLALDHLARAGARDPPPRRIITGVWECWGTRDGVSDRKEIIPLKLGFRK